MEDKYVTKYNTAIQGEAINTSETRRLFSYDFQGWGSSTRIPPCIKVRNQLSINAEISCSRKQHIPLIITGRRSFHIFENEVINPSSPQFKWIHFVTLRLQFNGEFYVTLNDKIIRLHNISMTASKYSCWAGNSSKKPLLGRTNFVPEFF